MLTCRSLSGCSRTGTPGNRPESTVPMLAVPSSMVNSSVPWIVPSQTMTPDEGPVYSGSRVAGAGDGTTGCSTTTLAGTAAGRSTFFGADGGAGCGTDAVGAGRDAGGFGAGAGTGAGTSAIAGAGSVGAGDGVTSV